MALRSLVLTALLAAPACGFSGPPHSGTGYDVTGDDTTEPPPPIERKCAQNDPTLKLCIDFDDDQTLTSDGSGLGHDAV
ncbi:MAG: hypothetical protein ABI175_26650, partial [Polyangiales bacterium]